MTIAAVSGSFDPITRGHIYVIEQALKLAEKVIVFVADNPEKKYRFPASERKRIIKHSIMDELGYDVAQRIDVVVMPDKVFTVNVAESFDVNIIVRGLRNVVDFEYEHGMQLVNSIINQNVTTVFVMPPPNLIAVSSSMIKGMVGIDGWERVAEEYIPDVAIDALGEKHGVD